MVAADAALLAAGLAALCVGGGWLVDGGVAVSRRLGVSPFVVGATVVAYGTSTPELAASLAASGHGGIILGNVAGSNIANVGLVVGAAAAAGSLAVGGEATRRILPAVLAFSLLLAGLSADGRLGAADGALLAGLLAAFTAYAYRSARRPGPPAARSPLRARDAAKMAAGMALLYAGAQAAVGGAVEVSGAAGVPERVVGLTVVAAGTSLPELITSIAAVRRGHADIGVGNIVGSCAYNVLMVAGAAALAFGVDVPDGIGADYAVMIAFSAALMAAAWSGRVGRPAGLAMLAAYAAYVAWTVLWAPAG